MNRGLVRDEKLVKENFNEQEIELLQAEYDVAKVEFDEKEKERYKKESKEVSKKLQFMRLKGKAAPLVSAIPPREFKPFYFFAKKYIEVKVVGDKLNIPFSAMLGYANEYKVYLRKMKDKAREIKKSGSKQMLPTPFSFEMWFAQKMKKEPYVAPEPVAATAPTLVEEVVEDLALKSEPTSDKKEPIVKFAITKSQAMWAGGITLGVIALVLITKRID